METPATYRLDHRIKKLFDWLRAAMLPKPKKPSVDPKYATMNRRMIAASIDSLFIMVLIAPLSEFLLNWLYHPLPVDWAILQQKLKSAASPAEADALFLHQMQASGQLTHWLASSTLQTMMLCAATAFCWRYWSATPGKILLRMRIVDATTEAPISDRQILLRLIGYFVSTVFLCAGFFWISIDKRRQGWHDKIAHTIVVLLPKKKNETVTKPSDQAL